MTAKRIEKLGLEAVKLLRQRKLSQGIPFMINSELLPPEQCFLEYPDGSMNIVEANSRNSDFKIVEELDDHKVAALKRKLKLI